MAAALYMDAVITRNQSLSRRGLYVVMGITVGLSLAPIILFSAIGAPLAALFVLFPVIGLGVAMYLGGQAGGRTSERIQVSSEAVQVARRVGGRVRKVWSSPTAFTRIDILEDGEEVRVQLRLSAKRVTVAVALSPDERRDFAGALQDAIRRARAERYAS